MPLNENNIFTVARRSLWDAIDNWPALAGVFKQKFKLEDDNRIAAAGAGAAASVGGFEPKLADLPAILIFPSRVDPAWYTNQQMNWPVAYVVTFWTKNWDLRLPEQLIDAVAEAFHKSTASGTPTRDTVSYVKAATGFHPQMVGQISFNAGVIGPKDNEIRVIRTQLQFVLRNNRVPFATNES